MITKTYLELINISTFEERYRYLKLKGIVGKDTFGFRRWLNQILYTSGEWRSLRRAIIIRDHGNDLACEGHEIFGPILVHHINAITYDDVLNRRPNVFSHNNLISMTLNTHNAIHYGDESLLRVGPIERRKNDTCLWR